MDNKTNKKLIALFDTIDFHNNQNSNVSSYLLQLSDDAFMI